MSNFATELHALIDEWLKKGDDPTSMIKALNKASNDIPHPVDTGPINNTYGDSHETS